MPECPYCAARRQLVKYGLCSPESTKDEVRDIVARLVDDLSPLVSLIYAETALEGLRQEGYID